MRDNKVGVLGGTSFVGQRVINQLLKQGFSVVALTRRQEPPFQRDNLQWIRLNNKEINELDFNVLNVSFWLSACKIGVVKEHFELLGKFGINRIISISSTSRFTKKTLPGIANINTVKTIESGEDSLIKWAEEKSIDWTIIRPTLIYGFSIDNNIYPISKLINKFGFFPLFGKAEGLRQPVYVDDVAAACVQALLSEKAHNKSYNISGAEVLPYHEMIRRVFIAMRKKPRLIHINLALFKLALAFIKLIPRYKNWNADMVQRMSIDMIFSHEEATQDFGFQPQPFVLKDVDVGLAQQSES